MKDIIDAYFSEKDMDSKFISDMEDIVVKFKESISFYLVEKIININIQNCIKQSKNCNISCEKSHALLHKIAGLNALLLDLDNIVNLSRKYFENLREEEKQKAKALKDEEKDGFIEDVDNEICQ